MLEQEEVLKQNKRVSNWQIIKGPVLIGAFTAILFKIEPSHPERYFDSFIYGSIVFITFILISYRSIFQYNYNGPKETFWVGIFAGGLFGLAIAVYRLIDIFKVWTVFNLVGEPILTALVGGVLVSTFSLIFLKIKNK